ncbi:MAG: TetR/AcrR family transcriptional regulator [Arachnia sp.]
MRSDAKANREAVLAAASEQIAAHGVDVALTTIAKSAGVGIATLYRSFPTREDLIRAVLDDLEKRMYEIIETTTSGMSTDPAAAWRAFVSDTAGLRPGCLIPAFAVALMTQGQMPPQLAEHRRRGLASIQAVLDQAKAAQLVRADLTATQFQLGIATITRPLPGLTAAEFAGQDDWLVDVFIRGLRP